MRLSRMGLDGLRCKVARLGERKASLIPRLVMEASCTLVPCVYTVGMMHVLPLPALPTPAVNQASAASQYTL